MSNYSIEGLVYEEGIKLIGELRANNIQADITIGGISIVVQTSIELEKMMSICMKNNATPIKGFTRAQDIIAMRAGGRVYQEPEH